jgi:hypothetical protein
MTLWTQLDHHQWLGSRSCDMDNGRFSCTPSFLYLSMLLCKFQDTLTPRRFCHGLFPIIPREISHHVKMKGKHVSYARTLDASISPNPKLQRRFYTIEPVFRVWSYALAIMDYSEPHPLTPDHFSPCFVTNRCRLCRIFVLCPQTSSYASDAQSTPAGG